MIGLWYEDFEAGQIFDLGSYHFTRERIIDFAREFDPQPFHLSDEGAAAGPFGRLSASGFHTGAAWMKRYIATNQAEFARRAGLGQPAPQLSPSPGFANLKWIKPVYVDDVITYSSAITAASPHPKRAGWGLVESHNEGRNEAGELVFSFEGKVLKPMRIA